MIENKYSNSSLVLNNFSYSYSTQGLHDTNRIRQIIHEFTYLLEPYKLGAHRAQAI